MNNEQYVMWNLVIETKYIFLPCIHCSSADRAPTILKIVGKRFSGHFSFIPNKCCSQFLSLSIFSNVVVIPFSLFCRAEKFIFQIDQINLLLSTSLLSVQVNLRAKKKENLWFCISIGRVSILPFLQRGSVGCIFGWRIHKCMRVY